MACRQLQELAGKIVQVLLAIEVAQYLHVRRVPDPVEPAGKRSLFLAPHRVDKPDGRCQFLQRARFAKKSRLARGDELRDSRDGRRQHDPAPRHRLHKHQRKPFASAGQDDHVGALVKRVHLLARHVADQHDEFLQTFPADQGFQTSPLRPVSGDYTLKIEPILT